MSGAQKEESLFDKVGECLYRYRPSGGYYARLKVNGKEIRRSLRTTDRHVAKCNLAELREELGGVDLSAGRVTLAELCDRYFRTVQHQKPKTVEGKELVIRRMKSFGWVDHSDRCGRSNRPRFTTS
jgi:hypothetical protein